ncbi:MAG: GNAT family N-acetyltransferase [Acidobacteriota bacterium]
MVDISKIIIELFSSSKHEVGNFSCGYEALDNYIKSHAEGNASRGLGRTFVAVTADEPTTIRGYYTLTAAQAAKERLPKKATRGLPGYPIPAILLARLAIDKTAQGKGLGEILLFDAFKRIFRGSYDFGIRIVLVDAIDEKAKNFYGKYGFIAFDDDPLKLFLPLKTIEALITE